MTISEIFSDVDFLCGSTSGTYATGDKLRNMNIAYQDTARLIWESDGGWQFDDSNSIDLPEATATLVHNQQDYTLPTTALRIEGVDVQNSSGNWIKMKPMDSVAMSISPKEFYETPGMPVYYDLVGSSIVLYPTPASGSVTLASGLDVYVNREANTLSATTASPGFPKPFHRILSYAVAMDFEQDHNKLKALASRKQLLESGLIRYYSKRATEFKSEIKPSTRKKWRLYI